MLNYFIDYFNPFPREVTKDQLGYRGGKDHFNPPDPPVPVGQVWYGVRVGNLKEKMEQ